MKLNRIASILTFMIGALSIIGGGMAMRGWSPGYFVLHWLPVYNFIMGVLTVFVPAILIWQNSRFGMPISFAVFGIHALATLLLLSACCGTPAAESIFAMTFRLLIWLIVLTLQIVQVRKDKNRNPGL